MLVEDVGHFGELNQIPPGPIKLIRATVPKIDVHSVIFADLSANNALDDYLVASAKVEVGPYRRTAIFSRVCSILCQIVFELHLFEYYVDEIRLFRLNFF